MKSSMEYLKVQMEYESADMPVVYFYEVDLEDGRFCRREIEVFADRRVQTAEDLYQDVIEALPIPAAAELNAGVWGAGFCAQVISKEEFEAVWKSGVCCEESAPP